MIPWFHASLCRSSRAGEVTVPADLATAVVSGGVSLVVGILSATASVFVAGRRARVDEKITQARGAIERGIAEMKGTLDKELAEQKNRLDNATAFAAEHVAHELMKHETWKLRSFRIIKHHLGGFTDDELKKILVRAGAIRIQSESGEELWGLLDRNKEYLGVERVGSAPIPFDKPRSAEDQNKLENFNPRGPGGAQG
jgi:hypothetical protein